ncbi:MAG: hypothetical protein AAFQ68_29475, partial [Bacteroidota bacterium]
YDEACDCYFVAELDRDPQYALWYTLLHIKKIYSNGIVQDSKYYINAFYAYPHHYISAMSEQGGHIYIFVNRQVGNPGPPLQHDTYVISVRKNLDEASGTNKPSIRLHREVFDELGEDVPSLKVNKAQKLDDGIVFTGSIFKQDAMSDQASNEMLLIGLINKDETIDTRLFSFPNTNIEGLSLSLAEVKNEFYLSARFRSTLEDKEIPLIARFRASKTGIELLWSRTYPLMRVDPLNEHNFDRGVEIPLLEPLSPYKWPAFVAKDASDQIVITQFSPQDGSPLFGKGNRIAMPIQVELLDGSAQGPQNQALSVLLSRKDNVGAPYVLDILDYFSPSLPRLIDLSEIDGFSSLLGRRLRRTGESSLGILLFAQSDQAPNPSQQKAMIFHTVNQEFVCFAPELLAPKTPILNPPKWINLQPRYALVGQEYHFKNDPIQGPSYGQAICQGLVQESSFQNKRDTDENTDRIDLSIYPNPASTSIQIAWPIDESGEAVSLTIYNQQGLIVRR